MKNNLYIIGNWKMNKTPLETEVFMKKFNKLLQKNKAKIKPNVHYGIAAPYVSLETLNKNAINCLVVAQNVNENKSGAYTGELSIKMIKSVGANAVILGHSERRKMFNETSEKVAKKAIEAIKNKITPIIAFGETLEEYENNKTKQIIQKMVNESTRGVDLSKVILAYEPIWAIGTGKTASAKDAQKVCKFVREITDKNIIIQYGGSVKPENIWELMNQKDINGALVGNASLDPESFVKLLTLNK